MIDILRSFTLRKTPQSRPADRRQVPNSAGGFTFEVSDEQRLRRFLVLGTDGGTYYTSAPTLTLEAAQFVVQLAEFDPQLLVDTIVDVSLRGAAPRQQPALFALALAASVADEAGRARALTALPQVARTGTHLFLFATYVEQFRGWGRGLRRGVAQWYLDRGVDELAVQVVKYRQREGWSHRDLLRLAHPVTVEPDRAALFDWVAVVSRRPRSSCRGSSRASAGHSRRPRRRSRA
jgi:60 kDa SS-A/Ro ribonucleoprotein